MSRNNTIRLMFTIVGMAGSLAASMPNAYVSNLSGNNITIINPANGAITGLIPVPAGPNGLAVTPDGTELFVVSQSTNKVAVLSTANNSIIANINVGSTPVHIAISPSGTLAYVVNQGSNSVSAISTATNLVIATIPVGSHPVGVAFSPDGSKVYVTNAYSSSVSVISTATNTVLSSFAAAFGADSIAISPSGAYAYVANQYTNSVTVHATATGSLVATISGFSYPNCVAMTPDGSTVFVTNGNSSSVGVINTASNTLVATVPTGSLPTGVAISGDGTEAYVANEQGFSLSIISTSTFAVTNTVAQVGVYPVSVAVAPSGASAAPPPPPPCTYALSAGSATFPAGGGPGSVSVTAPSGCAWTAASNVGWASITAGASGSGNGTVSYSVTPDNTITGQSGTLTIAGQTFTLSEGGIACTFSLSATSATVGSLGGPGTVNVTAPTGCTWTAASNSPFLTVTSGASGSGNGSVGYSASANSGVNGQSGTLTIASQTFTVTEGGIACTYSLSSNGATLGSAGGSGSVTVTTPSGCLWSAVSNSGSVSITSGANGNGPGAVGYLVTPNQGLAAESGTLTIAGQTFTLTENGVACTYSLSSSSALLGSGGGPGTVNVTAPSACPWTASSNSAFLSITAGGGGTGSGTVSYQAVPNSGLASETGTLTIAGQPFTVTESGIACTYSLSSNSASLTSSGGAGTVTVTAPSACSWTASSNSAFLSLTSAGSGNGTGTVGYQATPNSGLTGETGTLTIAGQTFTVTESGITCSYSLSSNSANVASAGGTGSVTVTAPAGCAWTAASNSGFLSIASGASGSGTGTVGYLAASNAGLQGQSGTLTIASQTFTVTEAGDAFAPIFVHSGGPAFTDPTNNVWVADNVGNLSTTLNNIANTATPALYQSERWSNGTLQYQYTVPNGSYNVTLKFAEFYLMQAGQRQMNIVINGTTVQSGFDILANTTPNTAYDVTFPVAVTGGQITIQLVPVIGPAKLNALEIGEQ